MHSISIYILRKEELRDHKIDALFLSKTNKISFTELESGILATTHIPNLKKFMKNKKIANITTDYFGGFGSQRARLYENGKLVYDGDSEYYKDVNHKDQPINDVLKMLGVIPIGGMDEFDTIGLGKYRTNGDFK